ncbi:ABC transporter substrate-binding protein [Herbaspirillum chlorophenolicum]|uniref:ABC transporter substrate-binding protein n=1 Tax=Herbaspirillum chlorophenolicum TaxID=211589 RepID=UPI0039C9E622
MKRPVRALLASVPYRCATAAMLATLPLLMLAALVVSAALPPQARAAAASAPGTSAAPASLQVLHWWTSAGERRALNVVVNQLAKQNIQWRDVPIPGGAGMGAGKVLKSMVLAGRAPEVTQLNGVIFGEWADLGLLLELDNVAVQGNWEKQMFPSVWALLNNRGHVVAAPLGIHRINTLFYNIAIFNRLGLTPPKTWDDFDRIAKILRDAGITPLAQSAEAWQVATLFENLVLAESGPAYYRRLFVDMDQAAYADGRMLHILKRLRRLGQSMDQPVRERAWPDVARSMANGEAAMFIMGDWAKGEFNAWGLTVDQQFGCAPVPGTGEYHLYSTDTLAMFADDYSHQVSQETLAQIVTSPAVQSEYNKFKGSIPVWRTADPHMDRCARDSWRAFSKGAAYQAPSLVHRMATDETTKDAIIAEVQRFFLDRQGSEEQAQRRLVSIARALSRSRGQ